MPLPLSYSIPFSEYVPNVAGVILSGGNDLSALLENSAEKDFTLCKIRDDYERNILDVCSKEKIPVLGICRGSQFVAYEFGCQIEKKAGHIGTHTVCDISGNSFTANSFHNFAITQANENVAVLCTAEKDNTIEAFKINGLNFWGIMWHIEREAGMENNSVFKRWRESLV